MTVIIIPTILYLKCLKWNYMKRRMRRMGRRYGRRSVILYSIWSIDDDDDDDDECGCRLSSMAIVSEVSCPRNNVWITVRINEQTRRTPSHTTANWKTVLSLLIIAERSISKGTNDFKFHVENRELFRMLNEGTNDWIISNVWFLWII